MQGVDGDRLIQYLSETGGTSGWLHVLGYVSIRDNSIVTPPEHLPEDINSCYIEGATCVQVGCFNAAGTMFRLCLDKATASLLPEGDADGLNSKIRRSLGLRLQWLFNTGRIDKALEDLSHCLKEDGNDGAHQGTLTAEDAEDLQDFANALLERLYSYPARLAAAGSRRSARRGV
jgi:tetratricopeptide (TPR) repeat protein